MLRREKGFTLIELLVVIAIIGILAAVAIPMYQAHTVTARLSEVTTSMSSVASAIGSYYHEGERWPGAMAGNTQIKNSLGLDVPIGVRYIKSASISALGVITFGIQNTGRTDVDAGNLVLTPSTGSGGINWDWTSSTVPAAYIPKK